MIPPTLRSDQVAHTPAPAEPNPAVREQGLAQVPDTMEHIAELSCCSILSDMCTAISSVYQKCVQWISNQFNYIFLFYTESSESDAPHVIHSESNVHSVHNHEEGVTILDYVKETLEKFVFGDHEELDLQFCQMKGVQVKGLMYIRIQRIEKKIIGFHCESVSIDSIQAFMLRSYNKLNEILDGEIFKEGQPLIWEFRLVFAAFQNHEKGEADLEPGQANWNAFGFRYCERINDSRAYNDNFDDPLSSLSLEEMLDSIYKPNDPDPGLETAADDEMPAEHVHNMEQRALIEQQLRS